MGNKIKSIADIRKDTKNFNKGTIEGSHYLNKSIKDFGAMRSIVVDKYGNIIAGNKTFEQYQQLGHQDIEVIETSGERLVVVKRNDLDLNTPEGREAALADNYTSQVGLQWDYDMIQEELNEETLEGWDFEPPLIEAELLPEPLPEPPADDIDMDIPTDKKQKPTEQDPKALTQWFTNDYYDEFLSDLKAIDTNIAKALARVVDHIEKSLQETPDEVIERLSKVTTFRAIMDSVEAKARAISVFERIGDLASETEKERALSSIGAGLLASVRLYKSEHPTST